MTKRTATFIAAALAAAVSAGPAMAGEPAERVSYRDLNLASAEGQAELQQRLDAAARRVCRFDSEGRLSSPADENACFRQTRQTVSVQFAQVVSSDRRGG